MDVREKLVELLTNSPQLDVLDWTTGWEEAANYLIAHGVTVQERGYWASLTDCANAGVYCSVCNKKIYKDDYARCNRKNKLRSAYCPNCGAKMVPHPPKGE